MIGVIDPAVSDVQINGTSILNQGIANIPIATNSNNGVLHPQTDRGLSVGSTGILSVNSATSNEIKAETQQYKPIVPVRQHESTFYGLAKAAGDTTQAASTLTVGNYTDDAKSAIRTMLGAGKVDDVQLASTSIVNNGVANIPYLAPGVPGVTKPSDAFGFYVDSNYP